VEILLPLIVLVAGGTAASVGYLVRSARLAGHLRVWGMAAKRVGLASVEQSEGSLLGGESMTGRLGPLRVRLERYRHGKHEHGTKIIVGLGHGPAGLSLRREGLATAFEKRFVGEREIEIGDPAFDEEYFIQGQAPLAVALLDAETRRHLAELMRGTVAVLGAGAMDIAPSLSAGVLEARVKESGFSGAGERVPEILELVLDVARRLVPPADVAARIAENLGTEPQPGVRLTGLLTLSREFPDHPATRQAQLAARDDPSPEVRLRAAIALDEEGRKTLLALVAGSGASDACVARAIGALGSRLPGELAEATLRRALAGSGRPRTARACLEALVPLRGAAAQGLMAAALRHGQEQVAQAAAQALGRAGTVEAVAELRAAAKRGRDLARASRQAIAEIQSRLTGAGPGQLSLAAGEAGALSLADGEPGRLSLIEDKTTPAPTPEAEPQPE